MWGLFPAAFLKSSWWDPLCEIGVFHTLQKYLNYRWTTHRVNILGFCYEMFQTKHAIELKTTIFEDERIFRRVIPINISLPTFSGCLCPLSIQGVLYNLISLTRLVIINLTSVCSMTYFTDNAVDFSASFTAEQSLTQTSSQSHFNRLISFLTQNQ